MSKEFQSYTAADIETFEGIQGIRAHPGMYIGDVDSTEGYHHLVSEVLFNSVDEFFGGFGTTIEVTLIADNHISVRDFGRGIPVDLYKNGKTALEAILEDPHTGGKAGANNSAYKISGGLHGIGLKAVVAVSKYFEVNVYRNKTQYKLIYKEGIKQGGIVESPSNEKTGTEINFVPSIEIFNEKLIFSSDKIITSLKDCCYLSTGLTIVFKDHLGKDSTYFYERGIKAMLEEEIKMEDIINQQTFTINGSTENVDMSIAFCWRKEVLSGYIKAYTNNIPQVAGTHITGFATGLCKVLSDICELDLKQTIKSTSFKNSLVGIVSIKIKDPKFASQNKERLTNEYVRKEMYAFIVQHIKEIYSKEKEVWKSVLRELIKQSKTIDQISRIKKESITKGNFFNLDNDRLTDAYSKDPMCKELFLVEGVSASGTVKGARDPKYQAVFSLRGKPLNVIRGSNTDKSVKNLNMKFLAHTLGDIDNLNYGQIYILADRDFDGRHITVILLGLILSRFSWLVEQNRLNICISPLFAITKGGKTSFSYSYPHMCQMLLGEDYLYKDFVTEEYTTLQQEAILAIIKHRFIKKNKLIQETPLDYTFQGVCITKKSINRNMYISGYRILLENIKCDPFAIAKEDLKKAQKSYETTRFKGLGEMDIEQLIPVIRADTRKVIKVTTDNIELSKKYINRLMGDDVTLRKNMINNLNLVENESVN